MEGGSSRKIFRGNTSLVFMKHFGSLDLSVIACIVLLLVSFDLFCAAVSDILAAVVGDRARIGVWAIRLAPFPILVFLFWGIARKTSRRVHTQITERALPRRVEVLVMLLSNRYGKDDVLIERLIQEGGDVEEETLRKDFSGSWRMPLEAIAYHLKNLKTVVAVTSKESNEQAEQFKSLVLSLTRKHTAATGRSIEVLCPSDLNGLHDYVDPEQAKKHNGQCFLDYVDFESAIDQNTVLNAVLDWLMERRGVPHDEIMIDVTGGKKISSVVGTVVALGKDWSVEYVSTDDYRVKEYVFTVKASDVRYSNPA